VKVPWEVGRVLTPEEWEDYCRGVMADCSHCDLRPEEYRSGLPDFAVLMKPGEWPRLANLAENLTREMLAAEQELLSRPDLYRRLGLPGSIRKVMEGCGPLCQPKSAARVLRFDFHFTKEGWTFSEANPDGPSGYLEGFGFTRAMAPFYPGFVPPPNPASEYAEAIRRAVGRNALVALVHMAGRGPLRQVQFISRELEKRGMRAVMVRPRRLKWESGLARVVRPFVGEKPSLLARILLAEWLPRPSQHADWKPWFCGGKTPMSPPGTALLIESKRLPVVWKELNVRMPTWRSIFPETRCPSELEGSSQTDWVFKRAYGAGGLGTAIAGVLSKRAFRKIAEQARRHPTRWVAQRRFESIGLETERGLGHVCLGIFTIDMLAAGAYVRIQGKPLIDRRALSIPVLIPETDKQFRNSARSHLLLLK
jgi:hypothetical protein